MPQKAIKKNWITPNIPKEQGEEIDGLIDKYATEIRISSRSQFVQIAVAELLEKVKAELREKGKKV